MPNRAKPTTSQQEKTAADAKVERPSAHFAHPADVVIDPALSETAKRRALDNIAQDATQLSVAANEGMTGGEPAELRAAHIARNTLDAPPGERVLASAEQYLGTLLADTRGTAAHSPIRNAIAALRAARAAVAELPDHGDRRPA